MDNYEIIKEANRCMKCFNAPCKELGCPLHNNIPEFIKLFQEKRYEEAFQVIIKTSNLPFICSFVCDYSKLCSKPCNFKRLGQDPIVPGLIEKEIILKIIEKKIDLTKYYKVPLVKNNKTVAIIGAGPSGISCAIELAKEGYDVTIFEKENYIGGELLYGIPNKRLNINLLDIQKEILNILNVKLIFNSYISSIKELKKEFNYVVIATGLQKELRLDINNELDGVISGREFLKNFNYIDKGIKNNSHKYLTETICVVGGGNTALDCLSAACSLAKKVILVYRREKEQMNVNKEELNEIINNKNIDFRFLQTPVKYLGEKKLRGAVVEKLALSTDLDSTGRKYPISLGEYETIDCDLVVEAIGNKPDHIFDETTYCIGDYSYGAKTVVEAASSGKALAEDLIKIDKADL